MKKKWLFISMMTALLATCQITSAIAAPVAKISIIPKAAAVGTVREHPVIRPMPGSVLKAGASKNFNYHTYRFHTGPSKHEEISGPYWELFYYFPDAAGKPDMNRSGAEILESYRRLALERHGKILHKMVNKLTFTLIDHGKKYWVSVYAAQPGRYRLYIVEQQGFKQTDTNEDAMSAIEDSAFKVPAVSKAAAGSIVREQPVIRPMPGSLLKAGASKNYNYHTYRFHTGPSKHEEVSGPYWELLYYFPDAAGKPDMNRSGAEILESYRRLALERHGEILHKMVNKLTFTLIDHGKKYWVSVYAAQPGQYHLYIVEQQDFN